MPIITISIFTVQCNCCKKKFESDEFAGWADKEQARDVALDSEWHFINDEYYCPNCVYWGDEKDDYVHVHNKVEIKNDKSQ